MPPRKVQALRRKAEGLRLVGEGVALALDIPDRDVAVAAIAGQVLERLRHEGRPQPVLLGDRLHHELEERMLVGGGERIVELPVHLELAVRVLMIVLIGLPAELQHASQISAMTS